MFKNYFEDIYRLAKSGTPEDMQTLKRLLEEKACIDENKTGTKGFSAAALLAQENNKEAVARLRELGADESRIAYGYGLGGVREYLPEALAKGYLGGFAHGAAKGGHRNLCEELYKNYPATLRNLAAGAASGKDWAYLESLCSKSGVDNIEVAIYLALSGDREHAEAWRIKHKISPGTMATAAAEGGNREYAEFLRALPGVTDKEVAIGAVMGGYFEYAETLRQKTPSISGFLAAIAVVSNHREYAEFLRTLPGVISTGDMVKVTTKFNQHTYAKFLQALVPKIVQNDVILPVEPAVTPIHSSQVKAAASSSSSTIQSSAITNRPSPNPATSHSDSRNQLQAGQFSKPKPNQSAGLQSAQLAAPQSGPNVSLATTPAAADSSSSTIKPSATATIPRLAPAITSAPESIQQLYSKIAALEKQNATLKEELRSSTHQLELVTTELSGMEALLHEKERFIQMQQQLLQTLQAQTQNNAHKRTADPRSNQEEHPPRQRQRVANDLANSGLGFLQASSQHSSGPNQASDPVQFKVEPK